MKVAVRLPFLFPLVLLVLWNGSAMAAQPVQAAEVLYVSGTVKLNGVDAKKGDTVPVGASIETQSNGHVYMRAVDGGFLVVRGNSKAAIQAYDIQDKNAVRIKIELLSGTARSITGSAAKANKEGFRFNTPVAAIGVRGTDFTVQTTATETLVAVASGGVAVSPLNDSCKATGFGPCQGEFVADLYATEKAFLRVVKGASAPVLVEQPAAAPNVPIPALDTPKTSESPELLPSYEESLRVAQPSTGPLGGGAGVGVGAGAGAQPPAVVQPPAAAPQAISWGRWQRVANAAPNSELFVQVANGKQHSGLRLLGSHFIARRLDSQYSRPVESQVSFAASGFDAYLGRPNSTLRPASVSNASLSVNFDKREFATQFDVSNQTGTMGVRSTGNVSQLGALEGGIIGSNAKVVGFLDGQGATNAVTLFDTFGGSPLRATGSVQWAR